jgi:histidine kinase/histidine kinase/DNA gyrase B/HSP90-like ATPase
MPIAALKSRYDAFADRLLDSLSEIERRDVRSFDHWFFSEGWRWLAGLVVATTILAWLGAQLPWNMSFAEAAILFNVVVLLLVWSGVSAWFGFRRLKGRIFRRVVVDPVVFLIIGTLAGALVAGLINGENPLDLLNDYTRLRHGITAGLVFSFLYALLVALISQLRNREYAALTAHFEAEARQSDLSRQLAESRLKLLQLQIEPHFLFNTLGSAQQLAEKGAPQAARLIADLIRFLRAATPSLRDEKTTLGQDAMLAEAYLSIMRTRLTRRLDHAIDVPSSLADVALPPGMLITLVENAIKHGIEPSPAGGRIDISARIQGATLIVRVADTGAGLDGGGTPGQGIGLANIRERLKLLYGGAASLELAGNSPRGFVASIVLPAGETRNGTGHEAGCATGYATGNSIEYAAEDPARHAAGRANGRAVNDATGHAAAVAPHAGLSGDNRTTRNR